MSEPPRWDGDERLGTTAIVHLTPGLDGVSRAVNEAERGLLPAEATVVVGQPLTIDELARAAGKGLLWIQLQELPWHVKGDAAGELDTGDGTWTESLRERYADRIQARLAQHIPNLESSILKRVVLSPADLQAANINLEQGDPYSGSLALDQNFLWRPFARQPGHRTPIDGLFQIGASTWPGPGLGAGSGTLVAKELLQPPVGGAARRAAQRVPAASAGIESPACGHVSRSRRSRRWHRRSRRTSAPTPPRASTGSASGRSSFRTAATTEALEQLEASGLGRAAAVPAVPSILPLPLMEGPADPQRADRRDLRVAAPARADSSRAAVVCLTGPGDDRDTVVEGLRTIGDEAARAGVRIGLEPINRVGGEDWTMHLVASRSRRSSSRTPTGRRSASSSTAGTSGTRPKSSRTSSVMQTASSVSTSPTGASRRAAGADRVLPGDGVADLPRILGALERAGWDGFYDLEIFSDNGTFGNAWPGSLWDVPDRGARTSGEGRVRARVGGANPNAA